MSEKTIHKGKHRAVPLKLRLSYDGTVIRYKVMFHMDCKYDLPGTEDDGDINKLFGFGYLGIKKVAGKWEFLHHVDSGRFGWYFNNETGRVVLAAYCYVSGTRIIKDMYEVSLNKHLILEFNVQDKKYNLSIIDPAKGFFKVAETSIAFTHNKKIQFLLQPYFGGNQTSPHDMHISLIPV